MMSAQLPVMAQGPSREPDRERRASVRWRAILPGQTQVSALSQIEKMDALILDLSVSGVGLVLGRRPALGSLLMIGLKSHPRSVTLQVLGRVVRTMPRRDGSWLVGCAFDTLLSKDELEALL
jgi:hypothetical protein